MKTVGIVGLPDAGASAVFTALTAVPESSGTRAYHAVVPVPDERVDVLSKLHHSKKSVYAQLSFIDVSGLVRRGARGAGSLPAELLGHLRECDALLEVVRGFGDAPAPRSELDDLELELVYADLEVVTGTLARNTKAAKMGDAEAKRTIEALERAKAVLDAGRPLRAETWNTLEHGVLVAIALLTAKPAVVVVNTGEGGDIELPPGALGVAAQIEAEVAGLPPGEAQELLESFGLAERGLGPIIRNVYERLDLITFLTAGEPESRAWEVRRGATAPEAAGVIHSDFERGFIRAEVVHYDDLVAAGSLNDAKAKGMVRQEGKAYVVQEGDVVLFRFAV